MNGDGPGLDFGIMCHGTEFEDWKAESIERLLDLEDVNATLLVQKDEGSDEGAGGLREKLSYVRDYAEKADAGDAINKTSWYLYRELFEDPDCTKTRDLSAELRDADRIECDVRQNGFSEYLYEDDLDEIRRYDLDFVLRFGFGIIRGEILDIPRYGVWSFHHGDERKYRGSPPGFWEIYEDDPVTGAMLQRLTDRLDGGIVLRRGTFSTRSSYDDNLDNVTYGSAEWPAQVATDVLNGNADYFDRPPSRTDAPIYKSPSPREIASYNLNRARSMGAVLAGGKANWNVGVSETPVEEFTTDGASPDVDWYPSPKRDGFIADPFPTRIGGDTYVFFEDLSYADGKGKISYVRYDGEFEEGGVRTALEEPYHLSYPYAFTHDGEVYATPEIHEANEIRLYRIDSPENWTVVKTLVPDVGGIDPTIVEYGDRWWMFYTTPEYPDAKLHVRYSSELTGPWKAHDNNPVKTDVRSSRPAGTPFVEEGTLYRPAQYSARTYGERIALNRVSELSSTAFAEETVGEIRPTSDSPYPVGVHTLSSLDDLTIIDGKRRIRNRHTLKAKATQIVSELRS